MSKPNEQSTATDQSGLKVAKNKKASQGKEALHAGVFQPNAAGIDIGAREIYVAVPADRDGHPVRKCETFTSDLHQMAEWLVSCGITTAAMESTGVYWIPVYDVLEQHGIQPCLVNPRNMKNVPGKRTDFHECQWIQHLHSLGLLHSARLYRERRRASRHPARADDGGESAFERTRVCRGVYPHHRRRD